MSASPTFLAFDLGAESGRALAGHLNDQQLVLEEVHRFANGPVTVFDSLSSPSRDDPCPASSFRRRGDELAVPIIFEPHPSDRWDEQFARFTGLLEASSMAGEKEES